MSEQGLEIPQDDREVATRPARERWRHLLEENAALLASQDLVIGGLPFAQLRSSARLQALEAARHATARIGFDGGYDAGTEDPIVMTGHQPVPYHPGVWAKVFFADTLAKQVGGTAIECVVDTDAVGSVDFVVPRIGQRIERFPVELASAQGPGRYFASLPAPSEADIDRFERHAEEALLSLSLPGIAERFLVFVASLREAGGSRDLAEALTRARRELEREAELGYLCLPVSDESTMGAFEHFVADIACNAERFRSIHNDALAKHRSERGIRSASHPFPDLGEGEERVELPFWYLEGGTRHALWARTVGASADIWARGERIARLEGPADVEALDGLPGTVAPRALALTMFNRALVADLFVHGVGGAAYDVVTDVVMQRFWGLRPPAYVAATLTMRLPLPEREDPAPRIAALLQRLQRLEHNPDQMLGETGLSSHDAEIAAELVREKRILLTAIESEGADKKAMGRRIREINLELAAVVEPLASETRSELARLEQSAEEAAVVDDRTYPLFLWDPLELKRLLT